MLRPSAGRRLVLQVVGVLVLSLRSLICWPNSMVNVAGIGIAAGLSS